MRVLLLCFLLWQGAPLRGDVPKSEPQHFLYKRSISISTDASSAQACSSLDSAVYAHSAEALKDLRLYGEAAGEGSREIPYAITQSQPTEEESAPAKVLNLGKQEGHIVFDLAMPNRPYTDVFLDLGGGNFIATARVMGGERLG